MNKLARRLLLLDDMLEAILKDGCLNTVLCRGYLAPTRDMQTCRHCAIINRAIRMGLLMRNPNHIPGSFEYTQVPAQDYNK